MPLMTYFLARTTFVEHGGPVSTKEIISFVKENLPLCTDDIVYHLRELESAGILKKEISREKRGFVWRLEEDHPPETMKNLHPEIYDNSRFFRSIFETALENNPSFSGRDLSHIDMLLGKVGSITTGMEKKPGVEEMAAMTVKIVAGMDFTRVPQGDVR